VIFVTVGTNEARFDRLLRAVAAVQTDEHFVIQHGHSVPTERAQADFVEFLPFERIVETMRQARAVVTHAGVGSIVVSLANGKRPVVVPRLKAYHEAVDDHQLQLGRRFAQAGLVTLVEDPDELGQALIVEQRAPTLTPTSGLLAADVRQCLESVVSSRRSAPPDKELAQA
jgi:UDP-N-acetylglucosamine transferase subunit ALG13